MNINLQNSLNSLNKDNVQGIIRELSNYGLGVCIPHMHTDSGEMIPLPSGIVQKESSLQISFTDKSKIDGFDIPVAWRWNNGVEAVAYCALEYPGGPHK